MLTILALTLAALLGALALPGKGASAAPRAPHGGPTDGTGIYESCDPHVADCRTHLDVLAQGGFRLVINYSQFTWDATIEDQIAYAAHANELGMKVIWPVNQLIHASNEDSTLANAFPIMTSSMKASGHCQSDPRLNYGFVACFVLNVRSLPGTWGYYIGDELPISQEPLVRMVVNTLVDVDPGHPRLYVAGDPGGRLNLDTLRAYIQSYCDGAQCHGDATVIAQDFYPIGTNMGGNANALMGQITAGVRDLAALYGVGYGMVLQAHSLAQYSQMYWWCLDLATCPYPNEAQERGMRDAVMAQGTPRLVLWYSSFDLQRSDNYPKHWADLALAANDAHPTTPKPAPTPAPPPKPLGGVPTPTPVGGVVAPVRVQVTDQKNVPIAGAIIHLTGSAFVTTNLRGEAKIPPKSQVTSIRVASRDIPAAVTIAPNMTYTIQLDLTKGRLNGVRSEPELGDHAGWVLPVTLVFVLALLVLIGLIRRRDGSLARWLGWASAESSALAAQVPRSVKRGLSPTFRREVGEKAREVVREQVKKRGQVEKRGQGERRAKSRSISMPQSLLGQSLWARDDVELD